MSRVEGFAGFFDPAEGGFDPGDRPAEDELREDVFALCWRLRHRVEPAQPGQEEPPYGARTRALVLKWIRAHSR